MRLHSPVLITTDLERLRRFYTQILGLRVRDDFGACVVLDCGLSLWKPGPGHPVQAEGRSANATGHGFELCFEADTVAEFRRVAEALEASGHPLLHSVHEEPWGQYTVRVLDPDGHLVEWGESIPCFVRRLYETHHSAAKTAEITGVALEEVERILEQVLLGAAAVPLKAMLTAVPNVGKSSDFERPRRMARKVKL
jgi:catechol 2,3-dioxygenase-like lactoylglutathione lyase family enzyme